MISLFLLIGCVWGQVVGKQGNLQPLQSISLLEQSSSSVRESKDEDDRSLNEARERLQRAILELMSHGGFEVCMKSSMDEHSPTFGWFPHLAKCNDTMSQQSSSSISIEYKSIGQEQMSRSLQASSWWEKSSEKILNGFCALICILIAALAAGLTLGMLGLDPLMLLIKQRASNDPIEREQASNLLPIVKQHHRLLVTLLLMNAVANEALPIFLEALVPPSVAVIFSVVFVLFFGEIIPSAIFTGPNQMAIASRLTPVVKTAMCLLHPIAMPISNLLDRLLHDEDDDSGANFYKRGELSALIRIQYEERMAAKRKRKKERKQHAHSSTVQMLPDDDNIGALSFSSLKSFREEHRESFRAIKSQIDYMDSQKSDPLAVSSSSSQKVNGGPSKAETGDVVSTRIVRSDESSVRTYEEVGMVRSNSIHIDEVTMVEGALSMKVKVAMDVHTPLSRVFSIPNTTVLSEKGVVKIYASGFSRIPVYLEDLSNKRNKKQIIGILLTKQLIVVNPDDKRVVTSMPLYTPLCVTPETPLVDLVNMFQT